MSAAQSRALEAAEGVESVSLLHSSKDKLTLLLLVDSEDIEMCRPQPP